MPAHIYWYKDKDKRQTYRNRQRSINYKRGEFGKIVKVHSYHRWSEDQDELVLLHDESDRKLAEYLGITVRSIQLRRWRLKKYEN
jgi:hypothetical protein